MTTVTVRNSSPSSLSLGSSIGTVLPWANKRVDLSEAELEATRPRLLAMQQAGLISWSIDGADESESTTGDLHLYVSPSGSDAASGLTPGEAVRTLDEVFARIPQVVTHPVWIHLAGGSYAQWTRPCGPHLSQHPIIVIGDEFTVVDSGTAQAGSGTTTLVTTGGLTDEEYQTSFVRITSGAAAGNRRSIKRNTTTNILPAANFSAAVGAGDTYEVFKPAARVTVPLGFPIGADITPQVPFAANLGGSTFEGAASASGLPGMIMVNVEFTHPAESSLRALDFVSTDVEMYGVRFEAASSGASAIRAPSMFGGMSRAGGAYWPQHLGLSDTESAWHGYGIALAATTNNGPRLESPVFEGFLTSNDQISPKTGFRWTFHGGSVISYVGRNVLNAPLDVWQPGSVVILNDFIVRNNDPDNVWAVTSRGGAQVQIASGCRVEKVGLGACLAIGAPSSGQPGLPGMASVDDSGVVFEGVDDGGGNFPADAIQVSGGGVCNITRNSVTVAGTFTENTLVIRAALNGAVIESAASLGADGDCLPSAVTADGRYGFIRRL